MNIFTVIILICIFLVSGMFLFVIPKMVEKDRDCTAKGGVLMKAYGSYVCINKDVVVK